ncbi:MAG TPA: hypothetical protein VFU47_12965 [Armatimonadota bacterium]|nr:hypothetical protein [Armatimonadota bacterium]
MPDEITVREVVRRIDDFARDTKEDFSELRSRLDSFVLREVYHAEQKAMESRMSSLEGRVREGEEHRRTQNRWVIGAVIIPVVLFVAQILFNLQGGAT